MNLLLIEDEKGLALELIDFLGTEGYRVDYARNKSSAEEKIFVNNYDFILLDLGLPDGDGLELLAYIKSLEEREDAIIILTARSNVEEKIKGLESGADDYLAKPFSLNELLARMNAIIRRKHKISKNEFRLFDFTINISNKEVYYNKDKIHLTKKEYDILNYLVLNKNRVVSRISLTEHIWGDVLEINSDSNFVDVHVKNLRKKLGKYASVPWLQTIRSVGYKILF